MTRAQFRRRLIGRFIAGVELPEHDCFGKPEPDGKYSSVLIASITLDGGTVIQLSGSPHVDVSDVTASLDPEAR